MYTYKNNLPLAKHTEIIQHTEYPLTSQVTMVEIDWDHPGGNIFTGLPASSLFGGSGYPAVARLVTDQKARAVE